MKRLKFADPLVLMVLGHSKYTTWRIDDDKDIRLDDVLSLCRKNGSEFARAGVVRVNMTTFGKMGPADYEGHETFASKQEMYSTYQGYYGVPVNQHTEVKVVRFSLRS